MKAGRRVHKVQALARKQSTVERTRHTGNETGHKTASTLIFLHFVVEIWQGDKDVIEIVAIKIIQGDSELRRRATQVAAFGIYDIYYL
jgi:hypothetical protein